MKATMKKRLSIMLCMMVVITVLSACASKTDTKSADVTAATTAMPNATEAPKATDSGVKQSLKINMTAQDAPGAEELAKLFEAQNNVAVTIERAPDDQYVQLISARLAAHDGPDLWLDWPEVSKVKARVKAGYIEDLTGMNVLSTINDKMLVPFTVGGKIYGIPWALNFMGLYYNKDLFDKNGYKIPTNYDEFVKLSEDLQSKNILPIAMNGKDDWAVQFPWFDIVASTVYSKAKDPKWDDKRYAGQVKFADSALWKDSAAKYDNLMKKGFFGKPNDLIGTTYDQSKKMFSDGKAAMIIDGSWALAGYQEIAKQTKMNIGTMALPANNAGEETYLTAAPSTGFVIWSGSKNKDLAKKFLEFVYSEANVNKLAGAGALVAAKSSPAKPDPIFANVMPFIEQGKTYEFSNINWPNGPQADGLMKETQAALAGASTFTKVLETLDKSWDKAEKK
jgi:raffinose/stachyose/melibiose transport system substrate-binding protein